MATPPAPRPWDGFLQSPALSFPPLSSSAAVEPGDDSSQACPREHFWHEKLLERWQGICPSCADGSADGPPVDGCSDVSFISYGAYLLLASSLADLLRRRLSLAVPDDASALAEEGASNDDVCDVCLRVGIAIPEGPFLPLYILAVHALNVAVGEGWLRLDSSQEEAAIQQFERCRGVALVPLETDEAPERLRHILGDSAPDLVLVAPGKDWESVEPAVGDSAKSIELVDFVRLIGEALDALDAHGCNADGRSFVERLWSPETRNAAIDSLRYPHAAMPGCYDVARLVAVGAMSLSGANTMRISANNSPNPPSQREVVSHVVYTSGTTGRRKGCVSSLASLQHYIRAKNVAHWIDGGARVLLASAVTFDPSFFLPCRLGA